MIGIVDPNAVVVTTPPEPEPEKATDYLESCLLFLCRHFEIGATQASIRSAMSGDSNIMSARQFIQVSGSLGITASPAEQKLEDIGMAEFPLVMLLKDGRAVIGVRQIDAGHLEIYDPGVSVDVRPVAKADLAPVYEGVALRLKAAHRRSGASAPKQGFSALEGHWFWQPLRDNSWNYIQVGIAAVTTNVLSLGISIFMMVVYDRVVPNGAVDSLVALTIGIGLVVLFDFIIRLLRAIFIDKAGEAADLVMGRQIFEQLLNMQMKTRRSSAGAFASMLREFESLRDFFTSATLIALVDLPFIILFIFVLFLLCGPVALVPALAVPIVLGIGVLIQPLLAGLAREAFEEGQTKQGVLVETISGLETIKASGAGPVMRQRWESSIKFQAKVGARNRLIAQFALNATALAQQVAQIGLVFFGVFQIIDGTLSMGALVAGVMLTGRALAPLAQLAQTMTRLNQAKTSYHSIEQMMTDPSERPAGRNFVSRPALVGKVEFRDVSFKYPNQISDAISNVSFSIAPGERVAILGKIGSGKSTIARLLLGLYEPEKGAVLIDDTDIRQIDPADLRTNIGTVLQDIWLFTGSVRQNIAAGSRASDAAILKAATSSGAHDFIGKHPEGYEMILAERGEGLSGGQRQSVAIARALVSDPPVILMDEPTSMMDMQSEQGVVNRLKHVTHGKTVIVVTHRTSMLDLVDRVIVIDHGKVVADGPKSILTRHKDPNASGDGTVSHAYA